MVTKAKRLPATPATQPVTNSHDESISVGDCPYSKSNLGLQRAHWDSHVLCFSSLSSVVSLHLLQDSLGTGANADGTGVDEQVQYWCKGWTSLSSVFVASQIAPGKQQASCDSMCLPSGTVLYK